MPILLISLKKILSQHPSKLILLKDKVYTPDPGTQSGHPDSELENENPSGTRQVKKMREAGKMLAVNGFNSAGPQYEGYYGKYKQTLQDLSK